MSFLKLRTHIVAFDVNPVKDGRFWGCSRIGEWEQKAPLHRFSHTYPTMMKLGTVVPYIKKIQKIYELRDTPMTQIVYDYIII